MASTFLEARRRLDNEQRSKYCGTVALKVSSLAFPSQTHASLGWDTESLKKIFEYRGGRQDNAHSRAKAIISRRELDAALTGTDLTPKRLEAAVPPFPRLNLPLGTRLECIQGCDRLAAADELFGGADKCWVVDLFLDGW